MNKTIALRITTRFLALVVLGIVLFTVATTNNSKAAANACPPEVYESCWLPNTYYVVDPVTCECSCPVNSDICSDMGNNYYLDPRTCTCADDRIDMCNDQTTIQTCINGGGTWNSTFCVCDY